MPLKHFDATGPNAKFLAQLNKMVDALNALEPVSDPNTLTEKSPTGTRVRPKELGTGGGSSNDPRWG